MQDKKIYLHLFKTLNNYYLYDTNANSIIKVNEKVYRKLQQGEDNLNEDPQIVSLRERGFLQPIQQPEICHPLTDKVICKII